MDLNLKKKFQEEQAGVEVKHRYMRATSHDRDRSASDTRSVRL